MSKRSKVFIFVLAVLTVVMAVLVILSSNESSGLHNFYKAVGTPIRYIQKGFTNVGNAIGRRISILQDYDTIVAEIDGLREENDSLTHLTDENERLKKENEELRALLEMKENFTEYDLMAADVITQDVTDWFNECTIDIGTHDGVTNGCVVITSSGLVGIVYNAGLVSSKVRCIVDEQNSLMARISGSGELVRVCGTSNENYDAALLVDRIAATAELKVGDVIETAESGGAYPGGIVIGTVQEVYNAADGTRQATVEPNVNFTALLSVSVLVPRQNQTDVAQE